MSRRPTHLPSRPWYLYAGIPVVVFVVVLVAARGGHLQPIGSSAQQSNPFAERLPFISPDSSAARAVAASTGDDRRLLERIAKTPTAVWLTPEALDENAVGPFVSEIVKAAERADQVPLFVLYGIPDRDCSGGESAGGLPADRYLDWVKEISRAAGAGSTVVLEPDALATTVECADVDQRIDLLGQAVSQLADGGPTTYVDAGHAEWIEPAEMASLLARVGVDRVRGFATNVAGYESEADERPYAEAVSAALDGAHYVIDSGRNGADSTTEWCNPDGRALGETPRRVSDDTAQDAWLWIKPPGESDGSCNGGPAAGEFWPERALALARNAGW